MQSKSNCNIYTIQAYFQRILFLSFFSIRPIPSRTLVMSYIRLFCTCIIGILIEFLILTQNTHSFLITCRVSAALFRSSSPSSACFIKLINFFVRRPEMHYEFQSALYCTTTFYNSHADTELCYTQGAIIAAASRSKRGWSICKIYAMIPFLDLHINEL